MRVPASQYMDALRVGFDVDDDELVENALVIAKTVDADGNVGLIIAVSEGLTWLDQYGLLAAASDIVKSRRWVGGTDDDG